MKDEWSRFIFRLSGLAVAARRDVWIVWLVISVVTTIPYIVAGLRTPDGHVFTGVLGAYDDTFTYFAWMRQSADGHWLMRDPFTSEPQRRELFLPLWSALGLAVGVTGLSIPVVFHIARLASGLVLLVVARAVTRTVMKSQARVRFSLWLYATSAGFGWLVYLLNNRGNVFGGATSGSVDLNVPEAIAFRSVFAQVHFAIGIALVAGAINLFFDALVRQENRLALIAGALVSLLAVVHPYMVVAVCAVALAAAAGRPLVSGGEHAIGGYASGVRAVMCFGVMVVPGLAYVLYLNRSNKVLGELLAVIDTPSPAATEYLHGAGVVALLAAAGFTLMWKMRSERGRLLFIWFVVQGAMLYAPLSFQRRLVEGLQLPLAIAASVAVFWVTGRSFRHFRSRRYRKLVLASIIVFASLTNLGFVAGHLISRGPRPEDSWRYLPADVDEAFGWLRVNSASDDVLLGSYVTGNVAPSRTGLRVFFGHYGQTIRSGEKAEQVAAFYSNAIGDEAARRLFEDHGIKYVMYGPFEKRSWGAFVPPAWLKLVHRAGDVEVFRVE
jgi:hypothetical protein